jgi:hypothetical protein
VLQNYTESVVRDAVREHLMVNLLIATLLCRRKDLRHGNVDRGEAFDIVDLDLTKAFDKVPHRKLFKNMESTRDHWQRAEVSEELAV